MAAVASQPRVFSSGRTTNGPITLRRQAISMIITMIGTAATPLMSPGPMTSRNFGQVGLLTTSGDGVGRFILTPLQRRPGTGLAATLTRAGEVLSAITGLN